MTPTTMMSPAELLVELDRLGVVAALRGDRISLRPASVVPANLLGAVREQKPRLMELLVDPDARWRSQAEALLSRLADAEPRGELLEAFDERRAIAAVDGGLDEDRAGRLAYRELVTRLDTTPSDVGPVVRPGVRGE
jgi:hypothetical protein